MSDAANPPVPCHPAPALLEPFRDLIAVNEYPNSVYLEFGVDPSDEWGMGNISTRAVRYSCGCLTRDDRPLDHRHDPAEVARCEQIATEVGQRLANFKAGEGDDIWPFFAAAVVGDPVPDTVDEALIRRAFGGTIAPGLLFQMSRIERHGTHWDQCGAYLDLDQVPAEIDTHNGIMEYLQAAWDQFAEWFAGVPGLREFSCIGIGCSDADPGILKPRMMLALTAAGSLVGFISYEAHA